MATTPTAVRESLVALIEAVAPTTRVADSFERYLLDLPFDEWRAQNFAHGFRRFVLRFRPAPGSPLVVNGSSGLWRYPFELEVAYPRVHYKDVVGPVADMEQVMDEDLRSLIPVIRDYSSAAYVAEEMVSEIEVEAEGAVMRITWTYEMWVTV